MTGFGVGTAPLGDGRVALEVRSLNHRFLDLRLRLPPELGDQSFFLEQMVRDKLGRGRFDVGVRLEGNALPVGRFSAERARAAYRALCALRDELTPGTQVPIAAVLSLPEVSATSSGDPTAIREALQIACTQALCGLDEMRLREGAALCRELERELGLAREQVAQIRAQSADLVTAQRQRLRTRLERLLADTTVSLDAGRLETELALLADKSDITEELVRLESHFDQMQRLFGAGDGLGRRLGFLLQEAAREANTIGAKSQDGAVCHHVVELKTQIERMREQVQNVE